ncbi:UbiA family prenyltransferase [Haloferula sp. A504]|uniref:UbiA family prenyltransferase n=1 Tax=Haloferula sp. A504 TaxID=3373601 RepID=UPI0031C10C55|nr:UbiA family prenyltransferase [Verrucomicrobiaceae bacterium E54]
MMRSLLASLRTANAPSVVSNVVLGCLLGRFYWGGAEAIGPVLLWLSLSALLLYFAGNLANDWFDRDWDKKHRPERALPQGTFRSSTYLEFAIIAAVLGVAFAFVVAARSGITALIIVVLIAIYTAIHKKTAWGVVPMGLCRAGLYVMGFLAAWPTNLLMIMPDSTMRIDFASALQSALVIATHALGLLAYIAGLSLAARCESLPHPPRSTLILSRAMLLLPLAAMSAWWIPWYPLYGALALIPFAIWMALCLTVFRKPVPRFVSKLLAGIPLIDWIAAIPLATTFMLPETPLPYATWIGFLLPPLAFGAALLLQKFTPAT